MVEYKRIECGTPDCPDHHPLGRCCREMLRLEDGVCESFDRSYDYRSFGIGTVIAIGRAIAFECYSPECRHHYDSVKCRRETVSLRDGICDGFEPSEMFSRADRQDLAEWSQENAEWEIEAREILRASGIDPESFDSD